MLLFYDVDFSLAFTSFPPGWIRLKRMIELKKTHFIDFILMLNDDVCVKRVLCERAIFFFACQSPVFDRLMTVCNFGLGYYVRSFIQNGQCMPKRPWQNLVWNCAWELENSHWEIQGLSHSSRNLLRNLSTGPMYMCWWQISGEYCNVGDNG